MVFELVTHGFPGKPVTERVVGSNSYLRTPFFQVTHKMVEY